jgi:hypothetical protein
MSKPEPCPNPACHEGQVLVEIEDDGSRTMADCEVCGGTGEEDASCTFCHGSGGGLPPFVCPFCKGTGSRRRT